jgi:cytochrome c553
MLPLLQGIQRGIEIMKCIPSKMPIAALTATVCYVASVVSGHVESLAIRNCTWCHGGSAQGYTPAPRLAGQRAQYIEKQLASFHSHARDNPFSQMYMWAASATLTPQSARELANYFSTLPPKAANDGDQERVALGQTIYQEGMPDANIVACVVCHGPNAEGVREIPRLGGLAYSYLKNRLEQWGEGYHAAAGPPMPSIAGKLSTDQVEALASYLSFVR